MIINNIIVHKINKKQATKENSNPTSSIEKATTILDKTNSVVKDFSERLAATYFEKTSRTYTDFKEGESKQKFEIELIQFINNTYDFYKFSRVIGEDLSNTMGEERMSVGGYFILLDYTSDKNNNYLFIALLNNKKEYSINNHFQISELLSLNIEKMAMASVINITRYKEKKDNYLTFLKGLREIPDYFIEYMGADKDKKRDLKQQTENWLIAIAEYYKKKDKDDKEIQEIVYSLLDFVKSKKKDDEIITADTIANVVAPEQSESFLKYIFDEENDFQLNTEMDKLDSSILKNYGIIKYENKSKAFLLKFSKDLIGRSINIDEKKDTITITDEEIVKGIIKERE